GCRSHPTIVVRAACEDSVSLILNRSLRLSNSPSFHIRWNQRGQTCTVQSVTKEISPMAYELAPLPYDYAALEPFIDAETMHLHHEKHHQTYVNNVNAALEKHPQLAAKSVDDLIKDLNAVPEDIRAVVRNNGGGHSNHTMFWTIMASPKAGGGGAPTGDIATQISADFGDFEAFKKTFNETTA